MKSIDARGIRATFNPWAVFVRRWELDDVHVQSGEIEVQVYEHKPEPVSLNPWFAIFLPNRIVLKRIESDAANVTWRLRDERAGFLGTRLLITPNGPDFEYRANGGTLRMAVVPDLYLRQAHLLITKTLFTLYDIDLAPNPQSDGSIRGHGNAGIGEDKNVDFKTTFDRLLIENGCPQNGRSTLAAALASSIDGRAKLEHSSGESLRVRSTNRRPSFLENWPSLRRRNHSNVWT